MEIFHQILCGLIVLCGFFVPFANSSIESVLFLILTFILNSLVLFLFEVDFLALLYIIIYVGAIAVLFLFIIMMLNTKSKFKINYYYTNLCFLFFFVVFIASIILFSEYENTSLSVLKYYDVFANIDVMGQIMFNNYIFEFLIAGLILLIALVGSVLLTLKYNRDTEFQFSYKQLSRCENFISFYK
jgi:NADH-quinone oxidoreductase subunit J